MSKQEVILCEKLGKQASVVPLKGVRMTSYSSSQTNIPSVFVCPH